ncbi:MAG: hypothetical protein U0271_30115 [Polyangiaceae bacterium]
MDDLKDVRDAQAVRERPSHLEDRGRAHDRLALDALEQALSHEELHRQVRVRAEHPVIEDLDEGRPAQLPRELGLPLKTRACLGDLTDVERDDLQRDLAPELLVVRGPDLTHAAAAHDGLEFVAPDEDLTRRDAGHREPRRSHGANGGRRARHAAGFVRYAGTWRGSSRSRQEASSEKRRGSSRLSSKNTALPARLRAR